MMRKLETEGQKAADAEQESGRTKVSAGSGTEKPPLRTFRQYEVSFRALPLHPHKRQCCDNRKLLTIQAAKAIPALVHQCILLNLGNAV